LSGNIPKGLGLLGRVDAGEAYLVLHRPTIKDGQRVAIRYFDNATK